MGKDFGSHVFGQFLKLRFELAADFDVPTHDPIMTWNTYGYEIISDLDPGFDEHTVEALS